MIQKEMQEYKELLDKNPLSYRAFSLEVRSDKELANYALEKNPFNMWYIGDRLKNDKDYAMNELSKYPTFHLNKLSENLQNDKEMVMFAMKHNATYDLLDLEHTCKRFIDDKEVMDLAVERMNANPLLVDGEKMIGRAMIAGFTGRDKALEEVKITPEIYRLLREEFQKDAEIAMAAISGAPALLTDIHKDLQTPQFYAAVLMTNTKAQEIELPLEMKKEVEKIISNLEKGMEKEQERKAPTSDGKTLKELIAEAKVQATHDKTDRNNSGFDRSER